MTTINQNISAKLEAMARDEPDLTKKTLIQSACGLLDAHDVIRAGFMLAAKNMGFQGDDVKDAFYYLQDCGAEMLAQARASRVIEHAESLETQLKALLDSIQKGPQ